MSSLSLNWIWGRSIRWQLIGGVAVLHALLMTFFFVGLIRWQEHLLANRSQSLATAPPSSRIPPELPFDRHYIPDIVLAGLAYTIVSAGLGTLLATLLARGILRQLKLLQDGVARWSVDQLNEPIPITGENEISIVSGAFNQAMNRLAQQQAQLREEIAARTRMQHEAEESNKAKDHFLAVLSHELRTPLTPMLTLSQMMERDPSLPAELREDITTIRRNVELEARLIDDLLDLTRITRDRVELKLGTVDVHQSLREVMRAAHGEANAKSLQMEVELWAASATVCGDATRLHQVLWNIVRNAIKFTPAGGRIVVQTHLEPRVATTSLPDCDLNEPASPSDLVIEISDTGVGIPQAMLGRVFDAFEQGNREVTRGFGGLGLGLTISRALVQLHGGQLAVRSEGVDRGTTFSIRLPLGNAAETKKQKRPAARQQRILLVEDHPDTSRATARLLQESGYEIEVAATVAAAIAMARNEHFDLILSDIGLPDGSGHDLIRRLMADSPAHDVKGIAISGMATDADLRASHDAGFIEHLVKPVDPEVLIHAVDHAMHGSGSSPSAF